MKLTTFSVARTNDNLTKLITDSETCIKINVRSRWTLSLKLVTSAIIYKLRFLHGNETVQYLKNYKGSHLDQYHYRKPFKVLLDS